MRLFKNETSAPEGVQAATGKRSAPERRRSTIGLSLMIALGLSVSAVIHTTPTRELGATMLLSAAAVGSTEKTDYSQFFKDEAMVIRSLPDVAAEAAFLKTVFTKAPTMLLSKEIDDYVSAMPADEARAKADAVLERQARAEREEKERAERLARQQAMSAALVNSYGYVGLNTQGIPMSQKGTVALDANGVPLDYAYCITAKATAYTNDPITSTGTRPVQGCVAVNPSKIPYGTRMWIVSADGRYVYGLGVAEDTGGFIYLSNGPAVDLFMYSEADCEQWGWRTANIYILN